MALQPGTLLGAYRILGPLGAGGMGEVYRAADIRLNRDVAIKVLPPSFANDEDRLRRFEQEALATSALNHPNILTVHNFGTHECTPYIVAELLEGEELRAQLNNGAIASRKAIEYATQIAGGLAAAHARAIVHRDLKPENIFITTDGRVKIFDFGLAKLRPQTSEPVGSGVATQKAITDVGTVMGTVGYMSPEQVRGQDADHRSDIFSFGVILYEMLRGRRTFTGESAIEVMNAILKEEPEELTETNAKISPALERIVHRCLEKKPERRFQSTSDLCFAIEALSMPSGSRVETAAALPAVTTSRSKSTLLSNARVAWCAAAALLLGMLGLAWAYLTRQPAADTRVLRMSFLPPEKSNFGSFAISPDGKWLAFTAAAEGKRQLWVRALDSLEAKALAGTEGADNPFWSPESRFIGFFADASLKKIEVSGGPVQTLVSGSVRQNYGGAWNRDGVIILGGPDMNRVLATGGAMTTVIARDDRRQFRKQFPAFLPDGRHFLYFVSSPEKELRGIYLGSLDGAAPQRLLGENSNAVYAASPSGGGWLLFMRDAALLAQPFDARRLELSGEPLAVVERNTDASRGRFSVSDNGVLVCETSGNTQESRLHWVDRGGKSIGSVNVADVIFSPCLSPDEKRFVVSRSDTQTGTHDLWLYDVPGGNGSRFTFDPASDISPIWSPDGSRIVWSSNRDGFFHLYQKEASGAGQDELMFKLASDGGTYASDWSWDGRFIVYWQAGGRNIDLTILPVGPLAGDQKPFPFLQTEANESAGRFSPDGRWMAYVSDESGRSEVYVQSFPGGGGKRQISTAGGISPHWRRDGKELFFRAPDGKVIAVTVKSAASFEAGAPVALFEFQGTYTETADGQRFLINEIIETKEAAPLTVVTNWTAVLKR